MYRGIFAAAVLAFAVVIAGCGGSDDSTASMTKAQFVKQADVVCQKASSKVEQGVSADAFNAGKNATPEEEQAAFIVKVAVPAYHEEAKNLEALGAPSGDEAEVEGLVTAFDQAIKKVEGDPARAFRDSSQFAEFKKAATAYGLKVCGQL